MQLVQLGKQDNVKIKVGGTLCGIRSYNEFMMLKTNESDERKQYNDYSEQNISIHTLLEPPPFPGKYVLKEIPIGKGILDPYTQCFGFKYLEVLVPIFDHEDKS